MLTEDKLLGAFKIMDTDNSGSISVAELGQFFGIEANDKEWGAIITEIDTNGDGEIDFGEFKTIMLKLLDKTT